MFMSLPPKGKILALDLGTRRTGVAVSDVDQKIAFLRDEIEHRNNEELYKALTKITEQEKIVGILAGLPINMNGERTEQTEKVAEQIKTLKERLELPIQEMDERLTSKQAAEVGFKVVDSRAAQILLETYFNLISHEK